MALRWLFLPFSGDNNVSSSSSSFKGVKGECCKFPTFERKSWIISEIRKKQTNLFLQSQLEQSNLILPPAGGHTIHFSFRGGGGGGNLESSLNFFWKKYEPEFAILQPKSFQPNSNEEKWEESTCYFVSLQQSPNHLQTKPWSKYCLYNSSKNPWVWNWIKLRERLASEEEGGQKQAATRGNYGKSRRRGRRKQRGKMEKERSGRRKKKEEKKEVKKTKGQLDEEHWGRNEEESTHLRRRVMITVL